MPQNVDPNAAEVLQDYLKREFDPTPEPRVEDLLDWGWHRVNVRPKKYRSFPFASYQISTLTPYTPSYASPPVVSMSQPPVGRPRVPPTEEEVTGVIPWQTQIGVTFDGGGSPIVAGQEFTMRVEDGMELDSWYIMADQTGSIQIDVWVDTWANYPPTNVDTITGGFEPNISANDNNSATVLAGWSPTLLNGDVITFHVDSCSTIERCTLMLVGTKT